MAIIIPSSKIYNKKNDKIIANAINKIEVARNIFGVEKKENDNIKSESIPRNMIDWVGENNMYYNLELGTYSYRLFTARKSNFTINIEESVDKIIKKIYNVIKTNEDGINESDGVQWKVYGTKKTIHTFTVNLWFNDDGTPNYGGADYDTNSVIVEEDVEILDFINNTGTLGSATKKLLTDAYNSFSITNTEFENHLATFNILNLLVGYYYVYAETTEQTIKEILHSVPYLPLIEFEPTRIDFTFKGETINLNLTPKNEIIGDKNSKNVFAIEENELIRKNGFFVEIYNKYKNGKETATIRCSISDYYDKATNEKIIAIDNSTNKMLFEIGDEVIPMVYTTNREDKPMSLMKDGRAKVFKVVGVKPYYDGAVWQELSLLETKGEEVVASGAKLVDLANYSLNEINDYLYELN